MMLWDIIRDWFVQYIFGGYSSSGVVKHPIIGQLLALNNGVFEDEWLGASSEVYNKIGIIGDNYDVYISIADWLSTTATIITLVLLLIMLFALVRFVIRQVCGLFAKI